MSDLSKRIAELSPEKREQLLKRLKQSSHKEQRQIPRQPDERAEFPLSYSQERLWYLEQLDPGATVYNFPFGLVFDGPFNVEALNCALSEIVRRHETLRTTFDTIEGQPVQRVSKPAPVILEPIDLRDLTAEEADKKVDSIVWDTIHTQFDLTRGPLFRAVLWCRNDSRHGLMICMHHIVTDGWSKDIFSRELNTLYEAYTRGDEPALPDLPIRYGDFATWQRDSLEEERVSKEMDFWITQLADAPSVFELPTDRPRPAMQTFPGDFETFWVSEKESQNLRELASRENATVFMVFLAAFKVLLQKYTDRNDIIVATPVASRARPEIENLIGFFVNNLVLRTNLAQGATFREIVKEVRQVSLQAFAHQDIPFEKIVENLQPERNLSTSPLFQVMFIMLQTSTFTGQKNDTVTGNAISKPLLQNNPTSKFDLTLYLEEEKGQFIGTFEYNTDLFDKTTMTRMASHLESIIDWVTVSPDQPVAHLELLTEPEKRVLENLNTNELEHGEAKGLHELFEMQVEKTPEHVALSYTDETLSYSELNARANHLARSLQEIGVGPDVLVGVYIDRSIEMVIALLGILKAGGAYLPLDPSYPQDRIAYMGSDSGARVILTQKTLVDTFPETEARVIILDPDNHDFSREDHKNPDITTQPENLCYVIYTSGSTGKPKGVAIPHCAIVNFLLSMNEKPGITARDKLLAVTTLSFDIAGLELFLPLIVGGEVILASREVTTDARKLAEQLSDSGATILQATPATWRMLLDTDWHQKSDLKMLCGGEVLPREIADRLLDSGGELWNLYGPTETTVWSAVEKVEDEKGATVPIGFPIGNTQIHILDRDLNRVPIGVYGELYIGGDGLARGYLNRPQLTADRFLPDPFGNKPGTRLYRTGDEARILADGSIEFSGRLDHQVKVRGFRIELGEIESVCETHSSVEQVVVMPREVSTGDVRLVAYVKYSNDETPTVSELRKYLRSKLPDYMIPSIFMPIDRFPLTPNGKVNRKVLPVPSGMRLGGEQLFVAPESEMEKRIAKIWHEVIGVADIGVHDNFFDLGGHSLLSMKVLYELENETGLRVNPREIIFKNLGQLASFCEQQKNGQSSVSKEGLSQKLMGRFRRSTVKS